MPSSRPVKPSFSVVVALMLTSSVVIFSNGASTDFMVSTCGLSFGRSAHTVASTLPTLQQSDGLLQKNFAIDILE